MKMQVWLFTATLFASNGVVAQQAPHACGAGPGPDEVMAGVGPGSNGVAPTPLCYWKSTSQYDQEPLQPAEHRNEPDDGQRSFTTELYQRYGPPGVWSAVAMGPGRRVYWNFKHEYYDDAENAALADCRADRKQRGLKGKCEILARQHSEWFAIATSQNILPPIVATDRKRRIAVDRALGICNERAADCKLVTTFKADGFETEGLD